MVWTSRNSPNTQLKFRFTVRPKTRGANATLVFRFIRKIKLETKTSRFYWRSTGSYTNRLNINSDFFRYTRTVRTPAPNESFPKMRSSHISAREKNMFYKKTQSSRNSHITKTSHRTQHNTFNISKSSQAFEPSLVRKSSSKTIDPIYIWEKPFAISRHLVF